MELKLYVGYEKVLEA